MSSAERQNSTEEVDYRALVEIFKKNGHFDSLRKDALQQFKEKQSDDLLQKLHEVTEQELTNDESLQHKNSFKAVPLIVGAIDRSRFYSQTKEEIKNTIMTDAQLRSRIAEMLEEIYKESLPSTKEEP
ncbi:Set1C complex subunit Shg1 [Schizosaccharomyces japonicus yFS275]|uniref:Set1C complex subunit Shg1 n=1 Tax=Schizosaccharomyces japonicus (strain yFS275 / FY16936) TaxID=402676 RepID=B6K1Q8_SCHJY|nr:Set1C complex subunit Shg1 [Schizosaccharomyces japonicus yFS275]EEB07089.1 Set1C complex subunit Shg1 [Schizosaccharomyces japonicus yFS275]